MTSAPFLVTLAAFLVFIVVIVLALAPYFARLSLLP